MQKSDRTSRGKLTAPVKRGRPRTFDREAALAQATRLFWLKGYEATSIAELTEAMGIGSPSLYAAFSSKEALYTEALRFYAEKYDAVVWGNFRSATTARDAVEAYLLDSAAALTGGVSDIPNGCMVTLSAVGSEGHAELGELVRSARALALERLEARMGKAVADGEFAASVDTHALARFVQTVQSGMSILARDGTSGNELKAVAQLAMLVWDARTGPQSGATAPHE